MTAEQLDAGFGGHADAPNADADTSSRRELASLIPGLRAVPGFPDATDDAVARMSLPRAYTACPNPWGNDLIDDNVTAREMGPYATDITAGKGHAVYKAHSYPTKVPHEAIMRFLLHYTAPGDLVVDGFCGSGMAGVAAQACGNPEPDIRSAIGGEMPEARWGARRAFLQDLSPAATFVAAGLNLPVDAEAFDRASKALMVRFEKEWGWLYETTASTGDPARIDYTIWSEVFTCAHCAGEIVFYDAAFIAATGRVRDSFPCPNCGAVTDKTALKRRKVPVRTLAGDTIERIEFRPVRIVYRTGSKTAEKTPDAEDLDRLRRISTLTISGFPTDPLPLAAMVHGSRLGPKGFTRIHHLWPDRALAALTVLWRLADAEETPTIRMALLFWIEQALWGLSWLNRHKTIQFGRPGGSAVNNYMSGVYYVPSLVAECSVSYNLDGSGSSRGKRQALVRMWRGLRNDSEGVRISTGSSIHLGLPDQSADYAFVDPPFGANIPYSDLALVVESWHGVKTDMASEATIDPFKHRGLPEYMGVMAACFREFYRVLKPGRWLTVEFSNSDNTVWLGIQEALASAGFVVADMRIFDKEQHSYRQVTATNIVKRDLIISAYRPRADVADRVRLASGSEEGVWAFVRDHLRHVEVTATDGGRAVDVRERQLDRLFDRVVAYHVASGIAVPMSFAEFADGIDQRFNRADGMYFLPNQEEEYQRFRLTTPRSMQESAFITNESSAVAWIRRLLADGPRAFTEIQPSFFKEVQTGLAAYEQMPDLRDLLSENFLQDNRGRWSIPDQRDAAQMERLHQQMLLRVFAGYAEGRGSLGSVRSEAIRVGFTKAWNDRDFELINSVGRRLPPDFWVAETALHHFYRAAERHVDRP